MGDPFQGGIRFEIPLKTRRGIAAVVLQGHPKTLKILYFGSSSVM